MLKNIFNTTFKRALFALLVALSIFSCKKEDTDVVAGTTLSISPGKISVSSTTDNLKAIVSSSGGGWDFEFPDGLNWVTASQMGSEGEKSTATVEFTLTQNMDTSSRKATIVVRSRGDKLLKDSMVITQLGHPLEMIFTPSDIIFDKEALTKYVDIKSNMSWAVKEHSDWITVSETTPKSKATFTNRAINITVKANNQVNFREGYISFVDANPEGEATLIKLSIMQRGSGGLASDKSMLENIYNNLGGASWTNKWNLSDPVESWYGVTVKQRDGEPRVVEINLDNNNLSGTLPLGLGDVSYLEKLSLSGNAIYSAIPPSISSLVKLNYLSLQNNKLSGQIPSDIGNLVLTLRLHLNNNELSGSIPTSISNMSALQVLTLNDNKLTGDFPVNIANIITLQYFYAQNNSITGSVPKEYQNNNYWLQWVFAPQK